MARKLRSTTEFVDAHGTMVKVGDRLKGFKVNTDLEGTVVELVKDPALKPFATRCEVNGQQVVCYFNTQYCEVI